MDIPDTASIQALLEQLKNSNAWQDVVASSNQSTVDTQANQNIDSQSSSATPSVSVAALLSQLQAEPDPSPPASNPTNHVSESSSLPLHFASQVQSGDSRHLTFQQALPVIASLSTNPRFNETLKSIKDEQNALELQLWEERKAILDKYKGKIHTAKTKATMIGSGMSKHEANMLSDAFDKELKRFDAERVLPAWDGLILQQQEALSKMGVPTMFPTALSSDREKQQKIIQILDGLTSS
ncbi:hypothetical protein BDP27DRAFT_1414473 [Rhodocollybia butyracea]|uniref:Uncharacterized protein n=1 Tax=Rhodocollybia butyracea TaxID=206335 RepID=A0A9P5Q8J0_9AGAR|nr:hypothetical protein BDP27DRAFT_1414473 [Rhodocollybia butyracea]